MLPLSSGVRLQLQMSARMKQARTDLQREAASLLRRVLLGGVDGFAEMRALPVEQWHTAIAQLGSLCPGFTKDEYVAALVRANRDNR